MKRLFLSVTALLAAMGTSAAVPELEKLVPDAKNYELIYKCNPLEFRSKGYQLDNGESLSGKLTRIGYLLKLTDKQDKITWVFTSMDPFTQNLLKTGVPDSASGIQQLYVTNLDVAGNVPNLITGKFEKGNIEFWSGNYSPANHAKIPDANSDSFDFGDTPDKNLSGYGSMQVHNYLKKQTVFAFNNPGQNQNCDLGIGNAPKGNPDWTFSKSGLNYKSAELFVVGTFENLKKTTPLKVDSQKISFRGESDKAFYAPNEPMKFSFTTDFGKQTLPASPFRIRWTRSGDDGKRASGVEDVIPGKPVVVTTSMAQPGFVRLQAELLDHKGKTVSQKNKWGRNVLLSFNGGAGVNIATLTPAAEEPQDFDAFWNRQKEKLAKVPIKYKMDKVSKPDAKVEVYAVSVDCAGPRPVTGYLTIPAGAKPKSLPALATYHGYGTSIQRAPNGKNGTMIHFNVNAHGYDLGQNAAYYKDFFEKIKSNGQIYAFDPKQNSDPETAYFNGMALRVMRSLQFLKTLPQWNGKDLKVAGGSQGGLQTIWAAALEPSVSHADSGITWCCDFAGTTKKRLPGWRPNYVPALNYYDCVFHAKRIKCPIIISRAGLGDYTCPPSGLAIMYNQIKAPKKIVYVQGSDHGFVPENPQKFVLEEK